MNSLKLRKREEIQVLQKYRFFLEFEPVTSLLRDSIHQGQKDTTKKMPRNKKKNQGERAK